jgi:hypothetical protein
MGITDDLGKNAAKAADKMIAENEKKLAEKKAKDEAAASS